MAVQMLENEKLRLVVDPETGVNVLAFYARRGDAWLPIMPDVRTAGVELKASSFLLAPYSNRIENGRFTFAGKSYQLANGERHASHGDVRTRPWVVAEATEQSLVCTFDSQQHQGVNWPWPFAARAVYALRDNVLASELTLWNRGASVMPAGLGWHPYFSRKLTQPDEPVQLQFRIQGIYPDANNNRIPSGPPLPPTPAQDFSTIKTLAPDAFLDYCSFGYDGNGSIVWPASGVKVSFHCSNNCAHFILFNPPKPYFAAEPVTNANNGVNLYAQGEPTSGIRLLAPDQSLHATFDLHVELN